MGRRYCLVEESDTCWHRNNTEFCSESQGCHKRKNFSLHGKWRLNFGHLREQNKRFFPWFLICNDKSTEAFSHCSSKLQSFFLDFSILVANFSAPECPSLVRFGNYILPNITRIDDKEIPWAWFNDWKQRHVHAAAYNSWVTSESWKRFSVCVHPEDVSFPEVMNGWVNEDVRGQEKDLDIPVLLERRMHRAYVDTRYSPLPQQRCTGTKKLCWWAFFVNKLEKRHLSESPSARGRKVQKYLMTLSVFAARGKSKGLSLLLPGLSGQDGLPPPSHSCTPLFLLETHSTPPQININSKNGRSFLGLPCLPACACLRTPCEPKRGASGRLLRTFGRSHCDRSLSRCIITRASAGLEPRNPWRKEIKCEYAAGPTPTAAAPKNKSVLISQFVFV